MDERILRITSDLILELSIYKIMKSEYPDKPTIEESINLAILIGQINVLESVIKKLKNELL